MYLIFVDNHIYSYIYKTWLANVHLGIRKLFPCNQRSLLTTMISDVCNLSGRASSCGIGAGTAGVNLVTIAITSCSFLPVLTRQYTGRWPCGLYDIIVFLLFKYS